MSLKQKYFYLLFIVLLFFVISFVFNKIPNNSLIAGGDFYQLTDFTTQLDRYKYAWFNQVGQGVPNPLYVTFPYYLFYSVVDYVLPSGLVASSIMFFFMLSSFFSFYISIEVVLKGYDFIKKLIVSLLYSLNPFVLTIFTYPWGHSHHFLIYIILPILVSNFIKIILKKNISHSDYLKFVIINLIALPAYGNISFFILVLLIYGLIFSFILLFKLKEFDYKVIKRIFLLIISLLILVLPILLPVVLSVISDSGKGFNSQEALGGENYLYGWIKNTSNSPFNIFNLLLDNYRYPFINSSISFLGIILNSFYFFLLFGLAYWNKSNIYFKKNRLLVSILSTFLVFFILSLRYFGPFEYLNKILYQSPFFIFFRSPDKMFVALTYFYTLSIAFLFERIYIKKIKLVFLLFLVILTTPYLMGTVVHSLNNSYNIFTKKSKSEYSYIVSVPNKYNELAKIVNSDNKQTAILSLPYSVKNSLNWSNYPMWGFVGHDITHLLFNKRFISANTFNHPATENKIIFKDLIENDSNSSEIFSSIQKFGTEYIIYHKDIDLGLYNKSKKFYDNLIELQKNGELVQVLNNDFFTAFTVMSEKIRPLITVDKGSVKYKKINPTLYILDINSKDDIVIKFLQSYETEWSLGLVQKKQELCTDVYEFEGYSSKECVWAENSFFNSALLESQLQPVEGSTHELCDDYANCWKLNEVNFDNYYLAIYYSKQNFVYLLLGYLVVIVSIFTIKVINKK